jgi:hypothetical protein
LAPRFHPDEGDEDVIVPLFRGPRRFPTIGVFLVVRITGAEMARRVECTEKTAKKKKAIF